MIEKKLVPYEMLVRWNPQGQIAGAHVQYLNQIVEDGQVLSEKLGDAIPISLAGEAGYPVADILSTVQLDALSTAESLTSQLNFKTAEHQASVTALDAMTKERDQLNAVLTQAKAESDALQAHVAELDAMIKLYSAGAAS